MGIQNIDQVMAAYGEYTGRSILSGFGTTFAFRVNDVGSREYIKIYLDGISSNSLICQKFKTEELLSS